MILRGAMRSLVDQCPELGSATSEAQASHPAGAPRPCSVFFHRLLMPLPCLPRWKFSGCCGSCAVRSDVVILGTVRSFFVCSLPAVDLISSRRASSSSSDREIQKPAYISLPPESILLWETKCHETRLFKPTVEESVCQGMQVSDQ